MNIIRNMRFTRIDVLQIITEPAKSAKAYGAALAAIVIAFAARNGLAVPAEVQVSIAAVFTYGIGAVFSFAVAWLTPSPKATNL
jgi:hypothetical protein